MDIARAFLAAILLSPQQVVVPPSPAPTPEVLAPGAPPRILSVWMNETTIPSGSEWNGRIVTSTNVASVEVRTESFSFVAHRSAYGEFDFQQHVLDIVPQYKRGYVLRVIARDAAGVQDERQIPITFR